MIRTRILTPVVTASAIAVVLTVGFGIQSSSAKKNDPATECLIEIQTIDETTIPAQYTCTDGAACDADGQKNNECKVQVRACLNVPGQAACTPQPLKKAKAGPRGSGIVVPPLPTDAGSACGAFTQNWTLKLKKNGTKPSKKKPLKASAKGTAKGVSDADKAKVQCVPCPTDSCAPTTTTTTTVTVTTTSSSTTTLPCGNGTIDTGETCDPDASPNGCSGGTPYCNATCDGCQANCSQFAFTLGDPTPDCGFPGQGAPGSEPFTGQLDSDPVGACVGGKCNNAAPGTDQTGTCTVDGDCNACQSNVCVNGSTGTDGGGACAVNADCTKVADLGAGCLYIGGGQAIIVPPGPTPDGSTQFLDVQDCSVNAVTLEPNSTGTGRECTVGPATTKHCTNGHPGTDGQGTCSGDNDCQPVCVSGQCTDGAPGTDGNGACTTNNNCGVSSASGTATLVCLPDPRCFFGNPLPINNGPTSTCVLNVIADGVEGTADLAAGSASITMPLNSWVYLTGGDPDFNNGNACPICDNGVCNAGPREGAPCSTNSNLLTTHDCPPPSHMFLAPLDVTLGPLTTGTASATASDIGTCGTTGCQGGLTNCCSGNGNADCATNAECQGIFCQEPNVQPTGGAFGVTSVRTIIENGSPATGGFDVTDKATTLGSVFCIPRTNNGLIDGSANLPGPGAIGLTGTVRLR